VSNSRSLTALALLAAITVAGERAAAQDLPAVPPVPEQKFVLANGDVITGAVISEDDEFYVIQHLSLGVIKLPKLALVPPAPVVDVPVAESVPPGPWSGAFEAGITGASGNTNQENFRTAFKAQHKLDTRVIDLAFTFKRAKQEGDVTEENGLAEGRVTWPEADSPWGTFVGGSVERDIFKDYGYRVRLNAGRTYDFTDTPETWLQGRFGLGASKDIEGDDDDIRPEGVLAIDYRHELSKTQRITASSEAYPILNDLGEFRSISRAAWESKLEDASPWIVKLGLEHRYDSDAADDVKKTDWAYFASLGYAF
jgi:putative salt-induced outer membrane protein YdiY